MDGEVSTDDVTAALGEDGVRVVDIREPSAFARGHIPGSENVPMSELTGRVESLAGADRIVTVCPHGQASQQAARLIKAYEGTADATVESMAGGLEAWDGALVSDGDGARDGERGADAPF
jgi:rhodanese-related sulfurtransferase